MPLLNGAFSIFKNSKFFVIIIIESVIAAKQQSRKLRKGINNEKIIFINGNQWFGKVYLGT